MILVNALHLWLTLLYDFFCFSTAVIDRPDFKICIEMGCGI